MNISLPQMQCDDGCGECCGPVACTKDDYRRVVVYARRAGVKPIRQGIRCPWYQQGKCSVYPARPYACRMFGHCTDMVCPRGYNANVDPDVEQRLKDLQVREIKRHGIRMLHEIVYSLDEIKDLLDELLQTGVAR